MFLFPILCNPSPPCRRANHFHKRYFCTVTPIGWDFVYNQKLLRAAAKEWSHEHPVASNMQGLSKEFSRNLKERAQGVCNEHTSKVQNCARNLQRRCMKYPKNIEEML